MEKFTIDDVVSVQTLFLIIPFIMGIVHCIWKRNVHGFSKAECFLSYFLIIGVGLQNLILSHLEIYHSEVVATYTGWTASPFIAELGKSNLAWGILGILSYWFRGGWRSATALGSSLFLLMSSAGPVGSLFSLTEPRMVIGPLTFTNLIMALTLLTLLAVRRYNQQ